MFVSVIIQGYRKESGTDVSGYRSACGSVLVGPVQSLDLLHLLLAPCACVVLCHEGVSHSSLFLFKYYFEVFYRLHLTVLLNYYLNVTI